MVQTTIYDFIGFRSDDLFNKISRLNKGQALNLGNIKIHLNKFGIYELLTTDRHEAFNSVMQCYTRVSELGATALGAV